MATLSIGKRVQNQEFQTARAAVEFYINQRDESDEGASTWPNGKLVLASGRVLVLSYNGRVWDKPGTPAAGVDWSQP